MLLFMSSEKCQCASGAGKQIWTPGEHIVRRTFAAAAAAESGGGNSESGALVAPLLGSRAQFCSALFHAPPSPEWGNDEAVCVRHASFTLRAKADCRSKQVVALAVLRDSGRTLRYAARYTNCWRGDTERTVHAEDWMVRDGELERALATAQDGELTLYLSYQPCHHSGGHHALRGRAHAKSCTRVVLDYAGRVRRTYGVSLLIRCCNVYRAHWRDSMHASERDRLTYSPKTRAAQQGLRLLLRSPLVELHSMTARDWQFLWREFVDSNESLSDEHVAQREALDRSVRAFFASLLACD